MSINVDLDAVGYPDTPSGRDAMLTKVFERCRERLEAKATTGKVGWNNPQWIAELAVLELEHKFHVTAAGGWQQKDLLDVINYCAFILAAYEKKILTEDGLMEPSF